MVTFEMTNWSDTTFEISNWTDTYPVLDAQQEELIEQIAYNETLNETISDESTRQDLSQAQTIAVFVTTTFFSLLSVIGSSLIILSVLHRGRSQLQTNTLYQFLLCLSLCDIFASMTIIWGTFAPPPNYESDPHSLAVGNDALCSANAFFNMIFGAWGAFYNCWISAHFWRTVQPMRSQQDDRLFRIFCHSSAAIICLLLGVAGFVVDGYGPHEFLELCYVTGAGKKLGQVRTLVTALLTLAATFFTASLVRAVRKSIKKSQRYLKRAMSVQSIQSIESLTPEDGLTKNTMEASQNTKTTYMGASNPSHNGNVASLATGNPTKDKTTQKNQSAFRGTLSGESRGPLRESVSSASTKKDKGKDAEVASQACWYYAAYLNTVLVPVLAIVVMSKTDATIYPGKPQYFAFLLVVMVCIPIQGALNFVVYIRPRVKSWREYYQREQEELKQRQTRYNLPTIEDGKSGMPSFFAIMKKALLEDVPKKRKRRIMPTSGASNVSAISAPSGMSSRFSTRDTRVSFANESAAWPTPTAKRVASIDVEGDVATKPHLLASSSAEPASPFEDVSADPSIPAMECSFRDEDREVVGMSGDWHGCLESDDVEAGVNASYNAGQRRYEESLQDSAETAESDAIDQ